MDINKICIICCADIETQFVKCIDPYCNVIYCNDCYKFLLQFSFNENSLPKCSSPKCKSEFYYSNIINLNDDGLKLDYMNTLLKVLNDTNTNKLDEIDVKNQIKDNILIERKKYINKFHVAIQTVIDLALFKKLKKINKNNKKLIDINITNSSIKCFNILCNGILNDDYICILCKTLYCKKCECDIDPNGKIHSCNKDDVESVQLLLNTTKCPMCLIPVEKIYTTDCNNITCPNCKTNFCYRTGKITIDGNHDNLTLDINLENKLPSNLYKDQYNRDIIQLIKEIENKKPKDVIDTPLIKLLKKHNNEMVEDDKVKLMKKISKLYEKNHYNRMKLTNYYKIISSLDKYHKTKKINIELLTKLLNLL